MIIKSYEVKKNKPIFAKNNFYLLYGENYGLKKDIKKFISTEIKQKDESIEILSLYELEILENDENFYNFIYSGSLFGNKKIITIYESTDKIIEKVKDVYKKYSETIYLIFFSEILEKKSKQTSNVLKHVENSIIIKNIYIKNKLINFITKK